MKYQYKILQLDNSRDVDYSFMRWEFAKSHGFDIHDYKSVYEGSLESDDVNTALLEKLFEIFNINHPSGFKGHSLSVSDVVLINDLYYYCDSFGWICIQDYVK